MPDEYSNAISIDAETFVVNREWLDINEPFLTAYSITLGQLITGIRVRNLTEPSSKISLSTAYCRCLAKVLLGGLSFSMRSSQVIQ